jgi:ATP-dependent Clp protease ATP-binding subunit ClpC
MARRGLPYTSRAKKALELSVSEARDLNHSYVGTEHLLLGLLREEKGIGAQVLTSIGVTVTSVREEVIRLLGTKMPSTSKGTTTEGFARGSADSPATITLVVEHPDGRVEARKFRSSNDAVRYLNGLEY